MIVCPETRALTIQEFLSIMYRRFIKAILKVVILDRFESFLEVFLSGMRYIAEAYAAVVQTFTHIVGTCAISLIPESTNWLALAYSEIISRSLEGRCSLDLTFTRILLKEVRKQLDKLERGRSLNFIWLSGA